MSLSYLPRLVVAGVAVLTLAAPANAFAATHGASGDHHPATSHSAGKKHHGKPAAARFTAVGVVTAVDAAGGVVTLNDKGGSRDLHGKSVAVTVGSATKITRDDASATLAQVKVGDRVMANGTRAAAGVLNAAHLNASSTPDPEPTVAPNPAPVTPPVSDPAPVTPPAAT